MFNNYIKKNKNLTLNNTTEKFTVESNNENNDFQESEVIEDDLYDKIAEELVEDEKPEPEIIYKPPPKIPKQVQVDNEEPLDDVVSFIEELEKSSLRDLKGDCGLTSLAYGEYSSAGQYPNIYSVNNGLSHENYDEIDLNPECSQKPSVFEVPRDATNDINQFKQQSKKEKMLSEKLWRCQNRLKRKCT